MIDTHVLAKGIQDYPPLPEALPETVRRTAAGKMLLADGCYFLSYGLLFDIDDSDVAPNHAGTLRVDSRSGNLSASADLYAIATTQQENNLQSVGSMLPPSDGIPIFPIKDYRLYLRITKIEPTESGFVLAFEAHRFLPTFMTLDGVGTPEWAFEGAYTALMVPAAAPVGYPTPEFFFVGHVSRASTDVESEPIGRMQMGWISSALRRAVIEIDRVPGSNVPQENGAGLNWQSVFQSFGWEIDTIVSDDDVTKGSDSPWNAADAEAARQEYRDSSDLDTEWRYYILVASEITAPGNSKFGFMYHRAREALFMTSQFVFPQTEPRWGDLRGARFDTTVAFFRTALHEMGHAMGLGHSEAGFHIMRPTDGIAQGASADKPFPANIEWSFESNHEHRLRHWPDIAVRPGGAALGLGGLLLPG